MSAKEAKSAQANAKRTCQGARDATVRLAFGCALDACFVAPWQVRLAFACALVACVVTPWQVRLAFAVHMPLGGGLVSVHLVAQHCSVRGQLTTRTWSTNIRTVRAFVTGSYAYDAPTLELVTCLTRGRVGALRGRHTATT
eukprot:1258824-Prymnesium_polylepis.2